MDCQHFCAVNTTTTYYYYYSTTMTVNDDIVSQRDLVRHVLEAVPFGKNEQRPSFLDVYNISTEDMAALDFSEAAWDLRFPIQVNKLLKLGISFGNLLKMLENEQKALEAKEARDAQMAKKAPTQTVDPFSDDYDGLKGNKVQVYHIRFAQNLFHILKNFDIGSSPYSAQKTKLTPVDSDQTSANGSQNSLNGVNASPIKLSSRQLLIEKLEINIRLDALFTYKVVLLLLLQIYDILELLLRELPEAPEKGGTRDGDTSSLLSYTSLNLSGTPNSEFVLSTDDYVRLTKAILHRVDAGIVGPFVQTLVTELVDTNVAGAFQTLITNI